MSTEGFRASSAESAEVRIDDARATIDTLDSEIIETIQRRRRLSHQIQQQRIGEGGPRTVLSREMIVIDRYRAELGAAGTAIATNILDLCRGTIQKPSAVAADPAAAGDGARHSG